MTLMFDEERIRKHLDMAELIPAMREALIDFSAGKVQQPVRRVLAQHGGFLGIMPASSAEALGAKLVTFYPGNASWDLHIHMAMIVLFRPETGEPLAVMDGRLITEMRTAAVSAAATQVLSRENARVLAILGSGVQARSHIEALRDVCAFDEVRVWSRNPAHAEAFAAEFGAQAMGAEAAVRDADVVVTATSAQTPVLRGIWLKPGAHVNAVGAPRPEWRELDDEAMGNVIVVDSREGAMTESGDVILSGATIHAELGEVLAGTKPPRVAETTIFKSLGMAVEDLVAARLVYDRAVR